MWYWLPFRLGSSMKDVCKSLTLTSCPYCLNLLPLSVIFLTIWKFLRVFWAKSLDVGIRSPLSGMDKPLPRVIADVFSGKCLRDSELYYWCYRKSLFWFCSVYISMTNHCLWNCNFSSVLMIVILPTVISAYPRIGFVKLYIFCNRFLLPGLKFDDNWFNFFLHLTLFINHIPLQHPHCKICQLKSLN